MNRHLHVKPKFNSLMLCAAQLLLETSLISAPIPKSTLGLPSISRCLIIFIYREKVICSLNAHIFTFSVPVFRSSGSSSFLYKKKDVLPASPPEFSDTSSALSSETSIKWISYCLDFSLSIFTDIELLLNS